MNQKNTIKSLIPQRLLDLVPSSVRDKWANRIVEKVKDQNLALYAAMGEWSFIPEDEKGGQRNSTIRMNSSKRIIVVAIAAFALLLACSSENNFGRNKEVVATAIKLDKNEIALEKGSNDILSVSFMPSDVTDKSLEWVSSNKSVAEVTDGNVFGVDIGSTEIIVKHGNLMDKCTVMVVISAKSISLNAVFLELFVGETKSLAATVEPTNTTDLVAWDSSEESVATVENGIVTAKAVGTTTICATAGAQSSTCVVIVREPHHVEAIDLGLSVKWGSCNLGGEKPQDFGDYYAWGEVAPYYSTQDPLIWKDGKTGYDWASYKWCNGSDHSLTKYNTSNSYGTVDNKIVLDKEDDAAYVRLGGKWRMPTDSEWTELRTECTWTLTCLEGVNGTLVSAPNGNYIFLPVAGVREDIRIGLVNEYGFYWSSSLYYDPSSSSGDRSNRAWNVYITSNGYPLGGSNFRISGESVRPVSE